MAHSLWDRASMSVEGGVRRVETRCSRYACAPTAAKRVSCQRHPGSADVSRPNKGAAVVGPARAERD
jgi:hypothetical protein